MSKLPTGGDYSCFFDSHIMTALKQGASAYIRKNCLVEKTVKQDRRKSVPCLLRLLFRMETLGYHSLPLSSRIIHALHVLSHANLMFMRQLKVFILTHTSYGEDLDDRQLYHITRE